jgi:multiple sugar transport system ATP-binding protein
MGFALKLRGGSKADIANGVTHAAEILGLTAYLDRMPKQLSGGQRQRVAMGRAIVRNPAVFLFDEPLSNLDAALRVQMRAEIRGLHERLGSTSIFVTHDQIEAMTLADRIVVMRAGRLEQAGVPLDLYDHPVNVFVASFIGSPAMNLLPGTAENGRVTVGPNQTVLLDKPATGSVIYGIRPEHLDLVPAGSADALSGAVTVVESTGTATFVAVHAGTLQLNALFSDRTGLKRGDLIGLRPKPGLSHLFNAKTEARIE